MNPGLLGFPSYRRLGELATTLAAGIVRLATSAESVTGTDATIANTPAGLTAKLAAPGPIGSTTPSSGAFTTLAASGLISANGGQIAFPATQNPSSDPNTFDDYEEGTCTLAITFATPGDVSVAYSQQVGSYVKIGKWVIVNAQLVTSSFTFTTASGLLNVTGLPFASENVTNQRFRGNTIFQGITKANYTQFVFTVEPNVSILTMQASAQAQSAANVSATDMPSGGSVILSTTIGYRAAA